MDFGYSEISYRIGLFRLSPGSPGCPLFYRFLFLKNDIQTKAKRSNSLVGYHIALGFDLVDLMSIWKVLFFLSCELINDFFCSFHNSKCVHLANVHISPLWSKMDSLCDNKNGTVSQCLFHFEFR